MEFCNWYLVRVILVVSFDFFPQMLGDGGDLQMIFISL